MSAGLHRFLASEAAFRLRRAHAAPPGMPEPDPLRLVTALRRELASGPARALAEQILLERRAAAKLPEPGRLLFERTALEQATSPAIARRHAALAPDGARVVDLGCGLGADSLAFATAGRRVAAVERDPGRARLARFNLDALAPGRAVVARGDAPHLPARGDVLYADPDRRPGGRRRVSLAELEPPWPVLERLARAFALTLVKAPPAVPDAEIPSGAAVEFLSEGGECREALLVLGQDARGGERAAVLAATGERRVAAPTPPAPVTERGAWLLDPDPALRRAGGVDALAAELGAARAAQRCTYLFAAAAPASPWVRAYPVLDTFAYRARGLARRLAADPPRELVVKQRGVGLDEAAVRRGLPRAGDGPVRVVVLFPRGRARIACLCGPPDPR